MSLNRRQLLIGTGLTALSGCADPPPPVEPPADPVTEKKPNSE